VEMTLQKVENSKRYKEAHGRYSGLIF
jgi:hypothetical protein